MSAKVKPAPPPLADDDDEGDPEAVGAVTVHVKESPEKQDYLFMEVIDLINPRHMDQPEKRLVRAVLMQGFLDAYLEERSGVRDIPEKIRRDIRSAKAWLASDDAELDGHYSFRYCCDALNVDPDWLRQELARQARSGTLRMFRYSTGAVG